MCVSSKKFEPLKPDMNHCSMTGKEKQSLTQRRPTTALHLVPLTKRNPKLLTVQVLTKQNLYVNTGKVPYFCGDQHILLG